MIFISAVFVENAKNAHKTAKERRNANSDARARVTKILDRASFFSGLYVASTTTPQMAATNEAPMTS